MTQSRGEDVGPTDRHGQCQGLRFSRRGTADANGCEAPLVMVLPFGLHQQPVRNPVLIGPGVAHEPFAPGAPQRRASGSLGHSARSGRPASVSAIYSSSVIAPPSTRRRGIATRSNLSMVPASKSAGLGFEAAAPHTVVCRVHGIRRKNRTCRDGGSVLGVRWSSLPPNILKESEVGCRDFDAWGRGCVQRCIGD